MATAHMIIHCLRGDTNNFTLYDDPLGEISKLCSDIKAKLNNYFLDPFQTFCVPEGETLNEIIRRMEENDWNEKDNFERTETIKNIVKLRGPNISKVFLVKELNKLTDGDLRKIEQKSPHQITEFLEQWLSLNLEDYEDELFDPYEKREFQEDSAQELLKEIFPGKTEKDRIKRAVLEANVPLKEIRKRERENLQKIYNQMEKQAKKDIGYKLQRAYIIRKKIPGIWKGHGYPSVFWLNHTLLGYIKPLLEITFGQKLQDKQVLELWYEREFES